jgi:hypothetical protein
LTNSSAHVKYIKLILIDYLNFSDPVILNSQFKEIKDSKSTRGELFWTRASKFYTIERDEWNKFKSISEVKIKNRVISSANTSSTRHHFGVSNQKSRVYNFKERPVSSYFSSNKSFRKELTLIKILNNKEIQIVKEVYSFNTIYNNIIIFLIIIIILDII